MTKDRERAVSSNDNAVSQERYELYKATFEWIAKSIREGFYLEAISLEESLITDRLESYLTWRTGMNFGFKTLGELQQAIRRHERDADLRLLVLDELDQWRRARNKAAHEMVKIEAGKQVSWQERMMINQAVATVGLELIRRIDRQTRRLRLSES
ncbi:MAG: hypothetical protein HC881_08410 [Leptolyngbyaceae cyanobacterium SL_7_1]|nr:hypothetical protein [Leptolyngbyaceae cyanobacterium SL_7_1]